MSLAERRLPQYCSLRRHLRDKKGSLRSFRPEDGKFIDNFSRFICFGCLRRERRKTVIRQAAKVSTAEYELAQELYRAGKRFKHHFKLGKWEFDFAFPEERTLLEIDGPAHDFDRQKRIDQVKSGVARDQGWRVVRVKSGPGLIRRVALALAGS